MTPAPYDVLRPSTGHDIYLVISHISLSGKISIDLRWGFFFQKCRNSWHNWIWNFKTRMKVFLKGMFLLSRMTNLVAIFFRQVCEWTPRSRSPLSGVSLQNRLKLQKQLSKNIPVYRKVRESTCELEPSDEIRNLRKNILEVLLVHFLHLPAPTPFVPLFPFSLCSNTLPV